MVPIMAFKNYQSTEADYFLKEGEKLKVGKESLEILFVSRACAWASGFLS